MDKSIFRAYDIRGKVPEQLNSEIMYRIGLVLGEDYKDTTLSYDIRKTSPALAHAFLSGFLEAGGDVAFQGMTSFGVALYSGMVEKTNVTSFITASHLPPEHNGLKLYYSDGLALSSDEIQKIGKAVDNSGVFRKNWKSQGNETSVEHTEDYVDFFASRFSFDGMKIGVDCGGGAVSLVANKLFDSMNYDAKYVYCKPNPAFTDRPSEPKPDNLTNLSNTIVDNGLDFGVGFDGDGDRAIILDNHGEFVSPEKLAIMFAREFISERGKATVVANIECSMILEEVLEKEGITVRRIPVGHTYMTQYVKDLKAEVGVEASGHMLIPDIVGFDDGVAIPVMLSQVLVNSDRSLSDLSSELPTYPVKKVKIDFDTDKRKFEVMRKFKEFAIDEYEDVNTLDGVKINFSDSWILVRASNTSPAIKIIAESRDEKKLEAIVAEFSKMLRDMK